MKNINQQWIDNLKIKPTSAQTLEILKVLESNADADQIKPLLIQLKDLLKDIQSANRTACNKGNFSQNRVDKVMQIKSIKRNKLLSNLGI